jgi:hypothetical protein
LNGESSWIAIGTCHHTSTNGSAQPSRRATEVDSRSSCTPRPTPVGGARVGAIDRRDLADGDPQLGAELPRRLGVVALLVHRRPVTPRWS